MMIVLGMCGCIVDSIDYDTTTAWQLLEFIVCRERERKKYNE